MLPAAEAMAMPSTFPEAFGMVAAEAAACGALPVVAGHSGLAEVARSLAAAVAARGRARGSPSRSARTPSTQLADGLASWLEAPADAARAHARGDRRRRARALLVGRRRADRDRRRRRARSTTSRARDAVPPDAPRADASPGE